MAGIALVDLDGMIYACGAIAEKVYYTLDGMRFDYKKEANAYAEAHGLDKGDIDKDVDVQPVANAINALKMTIEACIRDAGRDVGELYLSPEGNANFRFDIYPEYKANRKNAHKPAHYKALRNYAVKHLGAVICDGIEADDMINIRANELTAQGVAWTVVTVDKDLNQIPGDHYDWRKKKYYTVTQEEARYCLYYQVLIGDSVDNIKGCPGIGPAKAAHALKHAEDDAEMLEVCKWLYVQSYAGDEVEAMKELKLNIRLVRMLQVRP
jgi:hypothetical protein